MQISKLHPHISVTKIRAALTLCEGDAIESMRLLKACLKKINNETLSSPSILKEPCKNEFCPAEAVFLKTDDKEGSIDIYNNVDPEQENFPPLGSFPKRSGIMAASISPLSSISRNSTSASSGIRSTLTAESSVLQESQDGGYLLFVNKSMSLTLEVEH